MSYLNPLRLHFAGKFRANVSSINNDPAHFDTAAFQPSYQLMQAPGGGAPNGWFNPQGDASFQLLGCAITAAWTPAGAVTGDPVLECAVADSDRTVAAKLVDLDPEQQLVSEIWGLEVRIADSAGNTLMRGDFVPAGFIDIWARATGSGGDINACAVYQSVLRNLDWGDVSSSAFLTELQRSATETGQLSIKFNVDGLSMDFSSPDFMCGRVVGSIGPYLAGEPIHLVLGRQFMAAGVPTNGFFTPVGGINFFPAVIDPDAGCAFLDLGNALPTTAPGGAPANVGDLTLSAYDPVLSPTDPAGSTTALGTIPATGANGYADNPNWYGETAGVVAVPLSPEQLEQAQHSQLALTGNQGIVIEEWPNGCFTRADTFVYRMSPGDKASVDVYATQFGVPMDGVELSLTFDDSQLQLQEGAGLSVAEPAGAIRYAATATTDAAGKATFAIEAGDPGQPRLFPGGESGVDGQVYGLRPVFADSSHNVGPVNHANFVSLLLWSGYEVPAAPTWSDIHPILQQYANLYPVMLRFLNLADYDSIKANAELITRAFSLHVTDPNSMPVTRDLSPAKRQAILRWLANPLPGPVREPRAAALSDGPDAPAAPRGDSAEMAAKGGKAAALARRVVHQRDPQGVGQ
jgi:hypothetical protein